MNHIRLATLTLLVVTPLCAVAIYGQATTSARSDPQTTNAALREKAFEVLDSVGGQIGTLQSAENRARLGSNIAEVLWQRDEKRARTLFMQVAEDINTGWRNAEGDERVKAQTRTVFRQLRINTVERIAKHDAELALSFLKATEFSDESLRTQGFINNERNLALGLARKLAAANPELALKLGRESLEVGFSNELVVLLKKLNLKHREQATALYTDIIAKLKNVDLMRDVRAFYFGLDLARSFTPPSVDEASFRDLIKVFTASAESHGCGNRVSSDENPGFCSEVGSLVLQVERGNKSRSSTLERTASEENEWNWSTDSNEEIFEVSENGTVDELLALKRKYPRRTGEIYWRAISKLQASGEVERLEKIVTEFDGDPDTKRIMLSQLELAQKSAALYEEQVAHLQTTLNLLPSTAERIRFLMGVAGRIASSDHKAALKLLDQANGMAENMPPGRGQTEAQMALALMYCSEKSDRGLAVMESLIPKLNELVNAAAKLDGYDYSNLSEGEWNMSNQGSVGSLLTGLAQNAAYFAWCDFERALSLTMQFERTEIRLMAQLKLAQGILSGPPPRIRRGPPVPY
jgi:hypothetical protein